MGNLGYPCSIDSYHFTKYGPTVAVNPEIYFQKTWAIFTHEIDIIENCPKLLSIYSINKWQMHSSTELTPPSHACANSPSLARFLAPPYWIPLWGFPRRSRRSASPVGHAAFVPLFFAPSLSLFPPLAAAAGTLPSLYPLPTTCILKEGLEIVIMCI